MTQHIILNENTRLSDDITGAGLMRNRCAFTSRDMAAEWASAFTYAIVLGWHDDDHPEDDATPEIAERFEWDEDLIAFLRDAHERFKALPDRKRRQEIRERLDAHGIRSGGYGDFKQPTDTLERILAVLDGNEIGEAK